MYFSPMEKGKRRVLRRRVVWIGLGLSVLFCIFMGVDYWGYPYGAPMGGRSFNRGENGLWMRYTWYFGEHGDTDRRLLARQLREREIRHAFFHVRFIGKSGKLAFRYGEQARTLTADLHREAPGVKLIAWVFVAYGGSRSDVPLADIGTRQRMIAEALWLVRDCGFDGVQWDVEPCADGDVAFLALRGVREGLADPGADVSVFAGIAPFADYTTSVQDWKLYEKLWLRPDQ